MGCRLEVLKRGMVVESEGLPRDEVKRSPRAKVKGHNVFFILPRSLAVREILYPRKLEMKP